MFEVEINGKKTKAEVSFYTAYLYEAEFRSDLIKDLFGTQDFEPEFEADGGRLVRVDFTKTNWTAMTKVLWAAVKTANPSAKGYVEWVKGAKGANLWLVGELLSAEVADCFFRSEAAGEDDQVE